MINRRLDDPAVAVVRGDHSVQVFSLREAVDLVLGRRSVLHMGSLTGLE